jgi:hypothetical protein
LGVRGLSNAANDDVPAAGAGKPRDGRKGWRALARRSIVKFRNFFGGDIPENAAEARDAVSHFLKEMESAAARTYPAWSRILDDALAECSLQYEERRSLLDVHPIDDYYYAAVVALEAAKLRGLYPPAEAAELLGEIGDQVDGAIGRQDRVVSDLVFSLVGRIDISAGIDKMKMPYDAVVKALLQRLGFHKIESTKPLLRDVAFRHLLGEPLALGVPQWWRAFQAKFSIYWKEPDEVYIADDEYAVPGPTNVVPMSSRRRIRRRAAAF